MEDHPLKLGSPESFRTAREYLTESGFTEEFLLERFGLDSLFSLVYPAGDAERARFFVLYQGADPRLELARVFVGGYSLPLARTAIPPQALFAFEHLNLLRRDAGVIHAHSLLCPSLGLFLASDRAYHADGSVAYNQPDFVLGGADIVGRVLLSIMPPTPCRRLLDMGTGCGLAALKAAAYAGTVHGVDIVPRAIHYAAFNGLLNGVTASFGVGDLFASVQGQMFDRIVCNPPFEPAFKQDHVFAAGGEDGEALIARVFTEVPAYLEPGGSLYSLAVGTNREGESFEQRLGRWLGEWAGQCDVTVVLHNSLTPAVYAARQVADCGGGPEMLRRWMDLYTRTRATSVIQCHVELHRRAGR